MRGHETVRIDKTNNMEVTTAYYVHYNGGIGYGGFSFPCDPDGTVRRDLMQPAGIENLEKCLSGEYDVECPWVEKHEHEIRLCSCGSYKIPENIYDARGIYVAQVCEDCKERRLSVYRKDIFEDPGYEADEPIEEDC